MNSILEKSKQIVEKIYEAMNQIESSMAIINEVEISELVAINEEGQLTDLSAVLTEEQSSRLREIAICMMRENCSEAEKYLAELTGEKTEAPKKGHKLVAEKKEPAVEVKTECNESKAKEVAELYDDDRWNEKAIQEYYNTHSIAETARHFGATYQNMYNYIKRNGIKKDPL